MERPTVATVFAVLNFVFGAMGLICSPVSLAGVYFMKNVAPSLPSDSAADQSFYSPFFMNYTIITSILGFIAGGTLVAAGIGLLAMRNWGHLLSIAYSVYGFVSAGVGLMIGIMMSSQMVTDKYSGPAAQAGKIGGIVGGILGGILSLIYPIAMFYFMTHGKIIEAFEQAEAMRREADNTMSY